MEIDILVITTATGSLLCLMMAIWSFYDTFKGKQLLQHYRKEKEKVEELHKRLGTPNITNPTQLKPDFTPPPQKKN